MRFAPGLMVIVLAFALGPNLGLEQPKGVAEASTSRIIEAAVARPGGGGWSTNEGGDVFDHGTAPYFGSMAGQILAKPVVGIAATADGQGYWLTASDGGVFAFGDARFYGSTGALHLNRPIVGMAATPDNNGYWLVASDGGIFAFGDAGFYGSMGGQRLNQPIVGMAATPDSNGYWLVAADGGIFAFGDSGFFGSTGALHLNKPIVGMASTRSGHGYWMVASDGGIFAFGDAGFYGSNGAVAGYEAVSIATVGTGYWIVSANDTWTSFGSTSPPPTPAEPSPSPPSGSAALSSSPPSGSAAPSPSPPSGSAAPSPSPASGSALDTPVPHVAGNVLEGASGSPLRLLGVDVSGTEDACIKDDGISWGPLTASEAGDIASWHATAVRIPLNEDCWLGINGAPARFSGSAYQGAIKSWVANLNAAGLIAILDLHWSAPGSHEATQQWPMADADHSPIFWSQVASMFKSTPSVVFDLFNEPFMGRYNPTTSDWSCWLNGCATSFACSQCSVPVTYQAVGMQQLLNTVREAGATQPVMIGGLNWAGDPCGTSDLRGNGGTCMWLNYKPSDPGSQVIADFHTYNYTACTMTSCWNNSVLPVAAVVPVVTGELGEIDCSANYIDRYMSWADQHDVSYVAWSWEIPTTGTTGCSAANTQLLSGWNGTPSTTSAAGLAFASHLGNV